MTSHPMPLRCLILVLAATGALISAMTFLSGVIEAAPAPTISGSVMGEIQDMWLNPDSCSFKVHISWSDVQAWEGLTAEVTPWFLDESTDSYVREASSRGWRVSDTFTANMSLDRDERGSTYGIFLSVRSDENFAEPQSFVERNPFFVYTVAVIAALAVWVVIRRLILRDRARFESDVRVLNYLRFFKRM